MIIEDKNEKRRRFAAGIAFLSEAFRFVIIPLILIELVIGQFPLLTPEMAANLATNLIIFGGLVALFSAFEAYFPPGTFLKMLFGLLSIATLCAWFWAIFAGGEITFPYGPANISIDVVNLVLVIVAAISLKGVLHVMRFMLARKEKIEREARAEKKRMSLERKRWAVPAFLPDDDIQEPTFLHWRTKPEEPPPHEEPFEQEARCPVCNVELSEDQEECDNCGAWIQL